MCFVCLYIRCLNVSYTAMIKINIIMDMWCVCIVYTELIVQKPVRFLRALITGTVVCMDQITIRLQFNLLTIINCNQSVI